MNTHDIKRQTMYKLIMKTCKLIHGEASSLTLVKDLASHDKRNHKKKKTKSFIKINKLTKDSEFPTLKT